MADTHYDDDDAKERQHFGAILRAFDFYAPWATRRVRRLQKDYLTLSASHQRLLGTTTKIQGMLAAIEQNAAVLAAIAGPHRAHVAALEDESSGRDDGWRVPEADMDKLQSTLKQLVREWSDEGTSERARGQPPLPHLRV